MIRKRNSELLKELEEGSPNRQTASDVQKRVQKPNGSAARAQQVADCSLLLALLEYAPHAVLAVCETALHLCAGTDGPLTALTFLIDKDHTLLCRIVPCCKTCPTC